MLLGSELRPRPTRYRQETGRPGGGRINWALRKMDELWRGVECQRRGPGGFVPASRVCRPGPRNNNAAIGGMGRRGEGTAIWTQPRLLAGRCNKGGSQNVNQSMQCPRKAHVPTLRALSLFLVVKQGFLGRAGGPEETVQSLTTCGLGHGQEYKWRPRVVPHCGSRITSIAQ